MTRRSFLALFAGLPLVGPLFVRPPHPTNLAIDEIQMRSTPMFLGQEGIWEFDKAGHPSLLTRDVDMQEAIERVWNSGGTIDGVYISEKEVGRF